MAERKLSDLGRLPPVDEDSDLVGEENERAIPDDEGIDRSGPGRVRAPLPAPGAGAYPVPPVSYDQNIENRDEREDDER